MTTATLGIAVTSNADKAAVDLDKLTAASGKADAAARMLASSAVALARAELESARASTATLRASETATKADIEAAQSKQRLAAATLATARAEAAQVAARNAAAAATAQAEAGLDRLTAATMRADTATSSMSLNSANIAAQLQDVAVSAQMGMNPLQVALQQGTQLSAVLNQVRSSGMGVGTALATSFMSIINPISLVTIGLIGIGTYGIQALGGMLSETEDANDALEDHAKWLNKILAGYDDARDAAERVVEQALKLPQGAVESNLIVQQREAQEAYAAALEDVISANTRLRLSELDLYDTASSANTAAREQADLLLRLKDGFNSANPDLDRFIDALTELRNNATDDVIRDAANELLGLANQARTARAQADSLSASLRAIPTDIRIRLSMSQEFGSAMGEIKSLFMDPRSQFAVARENLTNWAEQATATANTYGELVAVGDEYVRVLESINAAEAKANAKSAKRDTIKSADRWGDATSDFQHRIDQQQLEIELFGLSTYEIERQRAALELLNEARRAEIEITPSVTAEIEKLSEEYARATLMLEGAKLTREQDGPFEGLKRDIAELNEMLDQGAISWEVYQAAMGRATMDAASSTLGAISQITGVLAGAFENNKALAVANAVVNTAEGVTKALAQGGAFAFPMAAAVAAAGAAQIASILSAKPGSSSVSTPSGGGATSGAPTDPAAPPPTSFNVTLNGKDGYTRDQIRELLESIDEYRRDGSLIQVRVA